MKRVHDESRWLRAVLLSALTVAWCPSPCVLGQSELPPPASRSVDYQRDILPVLTEHCLACHGPKKQESHFRLDRRQVLLSGGDFGEPAVRPGRSEESLLIRAVAGLDEHLKMPPEGQRLTDREIGLLRAWIDQGLPGLDDVPRNEAPRAEHWAFQPRQRPRIPPPVAGQPEPLNPIDYFVQQRLAERGLTMSPLADRRTLVRRVYLDVLGLPPTPGEVESFLEDDRPDAYEQLVDRVLASPRFGERWARHWLDVVRFAETNGFETNTPRPNAYRYRDFVIRSFNADTPYDQFVRAQLAGDAHHEDAATGFLVAGPYDTVKSPDPQLTLMQRQDELADMINVTGGAFLGLTLGCARCHNHKFDPVTQRDYYAMQAVFAGVRHGERPIFSTEVEAERRRRDERLAKLEKLRAELDQLLPLPEAVQGVPGTILIDDEDVPDGREGDTFAYRGFQSLKPLAGHGTNPAGASRGFRDDPGDELRSPNWSRGRYSWWQANPHEVLAAYRPGLEGRYSVWLSWGCGWKTHATDAEYVVDFDGDPATTGDQARLAVVDQQRFADGSETPDGMPLWSGLRYVGQVDFGLTSCILLRSGAQAAAVTADVLAFAPAAGETPPASWPLPAPPVNARGNEDRFEPTEAKYVRFTILATNQAEPCIDELEVFEVAAPGGTGHNVAPASFGTKVRSSGNFPNNPKHRLEHIHDGRYGNSFSWISNEVGRGWIEFDFPETVVVDRIAWARDREGVYADRLPVRYRVDVAVEPGKWRTVSSHQRRVPFESPPFEPWGARLAAADASIRGRATAMMDEIRRLEAELARGEKAMPVAYAGVFEQPGPTFRLYRGDPMQPREQVAPDALQVIGSLHLPMDAAERDRREALADWIVAPHNPLTARVIVNRLWHAHFGQGIVATPSDFGGNGARPTHPELLDWLATELVESGWSLKHIHRLILTSATYRQSSTPRDDARRIDGRSRFLWRFPPRRLEAEVIRDSILCVSDSLDLRMFGPGYDVFQPNTNYVRNYVPKEEFGPEEWRRMVYMFKVRMEQDPVFGAFDCPDAGQPTPARATSTTAIQALNLLNSRFMQDQATRTAQRIVRDAGSDRRHQVQYLFALAYGRKPEAEEARAAEVLVQRFGLAALCRAVLNSNEFVFLP